MLCWFFPQLQQSSNESNSGPLFSRRNHFCANLPHLFNVWYIFMSSNNKARDLKVGHPHRKQQQNILCRDLCNNQYDQFNISKDLLLLHDFAEKEKNWVFFLPTLYFCLIHLETSAFSRLFVLLSPSRAKGWPDTKASAPTPNYSETIGYRIKQSAASAEIVDFT